MVQVCYDGINLRNLKWPNISMILIYRRGKNKTLIVFSTLGQPTSLVTAIDGRDKPFTPHLTYEFVRTVNWELGKSGHFFDMFIFYFLLRIISKEVTKCLALNTANSYIRWNCVAFEHRSQPVTISLFISKLASKAIWKGFNNITLSNSCKFSEYMSYKH